jgi:hypothetical protein
MVEMSAEILGDWRSHPHDYMILSAYLASTNGEKRLVYHIVDSTRMISHIIEDDKLVAEIASEMMKAGVPVITLEEWRKRFKR